MAKCMRGDESRGFRDNILAVMRATASPVQAKEISRVLGVPVTKVASHLGYMRKEGIVDKRTVVVGNGTRYMGPWAFPESTTVPWFIGKKVCNQTWRRIREGARVNKVLPRAVAPRIPVPRTDDMVQMIEDLQPYIALNQDMKSTKWCVGNEYYCK